ncbi:MAG: FAD-dependent oxidoreductase [Desulfurispora sp.]|uniref:FAD-dependent oxidoreductase n=1 Tax=Desulfurispora sp. TaxID=3014275 RepID=UPI00404A7CB5
MNHNLEQDRQITGAVLIIGAGISGMQSALDLAEMGYKVHLVEKSPAIGGRMPMLDKTFPTNDCSMCILSPKLVECGRHRNIEVHTLAEITALSGEPGNFTVTVKKHPRYVDPQKCLGCGACATECPQEVPDEFNQEMGLRKAIYKLYPQAFPNAYVIDKENCLECGACEEVCPAGAIDHSMEEEEITLQVGAIILCPGFELFNARLRGEFGYGVYDNVITSLQFERMLSASGPYRGHVQRPSDGREPQKIAFIQCVGSRDIINDCGYCSAVCCMYATKEAIIAREHVPGLSSTIFCMDVRAYGKDFEKYYQRAQEQYGVRYVRCMISTVKELQQSKDLRLRYRTADGQMIEEDFDLVVLSVGLQPTADAIEMASILGLELNQFNFCQTRELTGVASSRPGIYVAGAFSGPRDIPETVMQASAAAGDAAAFLAPARGALVSAKTFPPERDVTGEEPRIGVFVCHCGINIGSVVNVPEVVEFAARLPHVVHAQEGLYVCSQDSQAQMKQIIDEKKLNRVVVASCSPRTHKPLFQETMRDAGLNKQLFEMANIRDQCSWVHQNQPDRATAKAKDLVKMAVAKAATLQPVKPVTVGVVPAALVIGGGVAGMTAALGLAEQGYDVHLVEKEDRLGGVARRIRQGFRGENIPAYLEDLVSQIDRNGRINVYTGSQVVEVSGYMGNFTSKLSDGRQIQHGVTIIATGGEELRPREYLYGQNPRVLTQLEAEADLAASDSRLRSAGTVAFIQCVGSREPERPYCSRVCCSKTMQLAIEIKKHNPRSRVIVFYRDIRTYGFLEELYRQARECGVIFIRYDLEHKPLVNEQNGRLSIRAFDPILGQDLTFSPDMLVLATAIVPAESNGRLSQLFKVPLNADRFFLEAHMKLRPVDFASEGVYMCGLAHAPKNIEESIAQGKAAAGRAATILARDYLEAKGVTARVQQDKCAACLTCVRLCPFNAPRLGPNHKAEIEAVICQGCGTCAGECPNKAIALEGYRDTQFMQMVDQLYSPTVAESAAR